MNIFILTLKTNICIITANLKVSIITMITWRSEKVFLVNTNMGDNIRFSRINRESLDEGKEIEGYRISN